MSFLYARLNGLFMATRRTEKEGRRRRGPSEKERKGWLREGAEEKRSHRKKWSWTEKQWKLCGRVSGGVNNHIGL